MTDFMKRWVLAAAATLAVLPLLTSCYGLAVGTKGMYYQTEKVDGLDERQFSNIGVYAVSDGRPRQIRGSNISAFSAGQFLFWAIPFPYTAPMITKPYATDDFGMTPSDFPDKLEVPFSVDTDTSNAGPSFELQLAMQKKLENRGFNAEAAPEFKHSGRITSDGILKHARDRGYDAAFIIVYTMFSRWQKHESTQKYSVYGGSNTVVNIAYYEGFLFVPNAVLLDVNTGDVLWSSNYYGIVSRAHTPNISNQSFCIVVNNAVIDTGRETYVEAASATVDRLFSPQYWKASYKPFPSPQEEKKGEKFDF